MQNVDRVADVESLPKPSRLRCLRVDLNTRGGNRLLALDKKTGKVVWWGDTNHQVRDSYYSYPVIANINGERLLISGGGDGGVHAFKMRTGEKVWSYIFGITLFTRLLKRSFTALLTSRPVCATPSRPSQHD